MRIACDIETNSLINPSKIWCICCKDIDTGEKHVFRSVKTDAGLTPEAERFLRFATQVSYWVGHNWLEFDYPVLHKLLGLDIPDVWAVSLDTLLLSRLVNYTRSGTARASIYAGGLSAGADSTDADPEAMVAYKGHSIESYGEEFGLAKIHHTDFTHYSLELETYCARDVEICHKIYLKYKYVVDDPEWASSIALEHEFQGVVNALHDNGFSFNTAKATRLLDGVTKDLEEIDAKITEAFPPHDVVLRTFTPKATKFGTISKTSVPRSLWSNISDYEVGKTYPVTSTKEFNPSSHKQLIDVLSEARWKPTDKTQTHIDSERELNKLKYTSRRDTQLDLRIKVLEDKLIHLAKYGFKINENNLASLPPEAPPSSRLLAKRILLESRRRTLTEWIGLVATDSRIHGKFLGIGAWTSRMAHQRPNCANIPNELDTQGKKKLLGKEMRSLWCAPRNRLLVGVDAEGIQLRIFAHLIDDKEFTDALVNGKKSDKTDPHSLNQRILGSVCKTRAAAKRFIYALLLGAGMWKLSQILECSETECKEALDSLLERYVGFQLLKTQVIPKDASRGYFFGLDGRKISIPGGTLSERKHLAMSGYLQSGEAIVMKRWEIKAAPKIKLIDPTSLLVNIVHDEKIRETVNDVMKAMMIGEVEQETIKEVGIELGLKCPLAASFYNEDIKDYTVGTNWSVVH